MIDAYEHFCRVLRQIVAEDADERRVAAARKCLESSGTWEDINGALAATKGSAHHGDLMQAYAGLVVEREA